MQIPDQSLHRFELLSLAEIVCNFSHPSSSHAAYLIDVTNDGFIFSENRIPYVIYDSICMNCSSSSLISPPVCTIKVSYTAFYLNLVIDFSKCNSKLVIFVENPTSVVLYDCFLSMERCRNILITYVHLHNMPMKHPALKYL